MDNQTSGNDDIYKIFSNAQSDDDKIEIISKYIFDLSKVSIENESDLIDEEIDDLYFDTISKLRKEIIEENSNINKYKLYKAYGLPSKEDYKATEQDFYAEDLFRMQQKIKEQEKELSTVDRGIILSSLEFKEFHEGVGIIYNKKKIGYKVFLKFKKLWKFQNVRNTPNNKINIYENLEDFKENYIVDFTNQSETNFYQYLKSVSNKYTEYVSSEMEQFDKLNDDLLNLELSVLNELELILPAEAHLLLFHDLWEDYCNEDDEIVFENPNLFCDIIDFNWDANSKHLIFRFFEIKKTEKDLRVEQQEFTVQYLEILRYIEDEKKEIERTLKQPQQLQNSVNPFLQTRLDEPKPFTTNNNEVIDESKQEMFTRPQKIKLLYELGIYDMMNKKNGFTNFQTEKILSDIFGCTDKTIINNFKNPIHNEKVKKYIETIRNTKANR